jgi:outer membrane protein assembly factor BamB
MFTVSYFDRRRFLQVTAAVGLATAATTLPAADADVSGVWPQWRGPTRDGQTPNSPTWPDTLTDDNFQQSWRVELEPSYSGPIVAADRVFVTETVDRKFEVVRALDRVTGKELWKQQWDGALTVPFFAASNGSWIRATPAFDGDTLYVAGMRDVLVALDAQTGQERWRVDFVKQLKTPVPAFGFVSSPLVLGDSVYVQAGASVIKLNKRTGEIVWRTLDDGGGMLGSAFSSPVYVGSLAGREQLLVQTRDKLAGVDPTNGKELWSQQIESFRGMNILTPTIWQDHVFTSSYGGKSLLFKLSPGDNDSLSLAEAWVNKTQGYMSSPVVWKDHAYLHLKNQRFTCIDLATGKEAWTTRPYGKYWSIIAQQDRALALDERGTLLYLHLTPEKFDLLAERKVSEQESWAHLAIAGDQVFVRDLRGLTTFRWR